MYINNESQHQMLRRLVATFIVAALLPALILSCFILFSRPLGPFLYIIGYSYLLLLSTVPVAFAHVLILGLPAYLIGKRFKMINWWSSTATGFMIGALPQLLSSWQKQGNLAWWDFMPVAVPGAFGGFAFWLLWHYWVQNNQHDDVTKNDPIK